MFSLSSLAAHIEQLLGQDPQNIPHPRSDHSDDEFDIAIHGCAHAIDDLIRLAVTLKSRRNAARSPIFRLPEELVEAIFYLSTPEGRKSNANFVLGQVCSRWRTIALGSARLWSRIVADYDTNVSAFEELLRRSRTHTLELDISTRLDVYRDYDNEDEDPTPLMVEHLKEVIALAMSSLPRTRRLRVQLWDSCWRDIRSAFNRIPSSPLPLLEALSVDGQGNVDTNSLRFLTRGLPALRTLTVTSLTSNTFSASLLHLVGPTVTNLELRRISNFDFFLNLNRARWAEVLLSALRHMPMLAAFTFSGMPLTQMVLPEQEGPIHLPCLHYLSLAGYPAEIGWLLSLLEVPSVATVIAFPLLLSSENTDDLRSAIGYTVTAILRSRISLPISRLPYRARYHCEFEPLVHYHVHKITVWAHGLSGYSAHGPRRIPSPQITLATQKDLGLSGKEVAFPWPSLPLEDVYEFDLDPVGLPTNTTHEWRRRTLAALVSYIRGMRSLERLSFRGWDLQSLDTVMSADLSVMCGTSSTLR